MSNTVKIQVLLGSTGLILFGRKPSVLVKDGKGGEVQRNFPPVRVIVPAGSSTISKDDYNAIKDVDIVKTMVEEGQIRFPDDKAMEKSFRSKHAARQKRLEELSADQDERKDNKEERISYEEEIAALNKRNAELTKSSDALEARLAKLEKDATKTTVKTPPAPANPPPAGKTPQQNQ